MGKIPVQETYKYHKLDLGLFCFSTLNVIILFSKDFADL